MGMRCEQNYILIFSNNNVYFLLAFIVLVCRIIKIVLMCRNRVIANAIVMNANGIQFH